MTTRVPLPRWVDVALLPLLNVVLAFIIGGLIVLAVGQNPIEAVRLMLFGAFGYGSGFGYTLYYTPDFIFAGLAVSLAFHAGLFNIGPESQAYVGGLGVILAGLAVNGLHWAFSVPLMIVAGALFGYTFTMLAFWIVMVAGMSSRVGFAIVWILLALLIWTATGRARPLATRSSSRG